MKNISRNIEIKHTPRTFGDPYEPTSGHIKDRQWTIKKVSYKRRRRPWAIQLTRMIIYSGFPPTVQSMPSTTSTQAWEDSQGLVEHLACDGGTSNKFPLEVQHCCRCRFHAQVARILVSEVIESCNNTCDYELVTLEAPRRIAM